MRRLRKRLQEIASRENVDLIHAHSPSLNGNPARAVARTLGIPVVYEMRSIWEEYPVDHRPSLFERLRYVAGRQVETRLFRNVDAVFTICKGLQDEIVSRGIPKEKTFIFPNGVDVKKFSARVPNENLRQQLGLQGKFVVAYIGSLSHWEGLEVLLRALPLVAKSRPEVHTLLVGKDDGDQYKSLATKLNVQANVTFVGSVKPEQILDYYSVVDLCVYPRKRMRLTELVTPLKPLEAMALGKFVLASDVGGLKELVDDEQTGFLFKADDETDLAEKIIHIAAHRTELSAISNNAISHVTATRSWLNIAKNYQSVYQALIEKSH